MLAGIIIVALGMFMGILVFEGFRAVKYSGFHREVGYECMNAV